MAAKVTALPHGVHVTTSQLAEETGFARETVNKRLKEAGVKPAGKRGSYPLYRLRDALSAVYQLDEQEADPERLDPFKRHAFYKAERERRQLEVDSGQLIPAGEVETERARVMKILTQGLETLPDVLERDLGLTPAVVAKIEEHCDKHREGLYTALVGDDEKADAGRKVRSGA
jgi:hypothetical protein